MTAPTKRTEGELTSRVVTGSCATRLYANNEIVAELPFRQGKPNAANAEYIRKAWNMHEELVNFVTEVIGFSVNLRQTDPNWQDHPDCGLLYAKATILLSHCQQ